MDAVLFDMDGVVVDSEQYWVDAAYTIIDHAIAEEPVAAGIDPAEFAGMDVRESYRALQESPDATVEFSEQDYRTMYGRFAPDVYAEADLLDGLHEEAERLHGHGVDVGLVSGSYWVDQVVDRHDLGEVFDVTVATPDRELDGKPAPDGYRAAADDLGVAPERCVAVEDSAAGIRAAADAGMTVIAYGGTPRQDHARADVAVGTADGLWAEIRERMDA